VRALALRCAGHDKESRPCALTSQPLWLFSRRVPSMDMDMDMDMDMVRSMNASIYTARTADQTPGTLHAARLLAAISASCASRSCTKRSTLGWRQLEQRLQQRLQQRL